MDEIDFYGDKEVKRNRRYLIFGSLAVLVVLIVIVVSLYAFTSFFGQARKTIDNTSSEKTSWELKFKGVKIDLSNIATKFNDVSTSGSWSLNPRTSKESCITGLADSQRFSIICTASISSELHSDNESDMKQAIDAYRDIIQKSEYFPQIKLVSENEYPSLTGESFQVREILTYERWGKGITCELTFKPTKNSPVDAKLMCSVTVTIDKNGNAVS